MRPVRTREALVDPSTGEVVEELVVDEGPEWRPFETAERSRAAPVTPLRPWAGTRRPRGPLPDLLAELERVCAEAGLTRSQCDRAAAIAARAGRRPGEPLRRLAVAAAYAAALEAGNAAALVRLRELYGEEGELPTFARLAELGVRPDYARLLAAFAELASPDQECAALAARLAAAWRPLVSSSLRCVAAAAAYVAARLLGRDVTERAVAARVGGGEQCVRTVMARLRLRVVYRACGRELHWRAGQDSAGLRGPDRACDEMGLPPCPPPDPRSVRVSGALVEVELPCPRG